MAVEGSEPLDLSTGEPSPLNGGSTHVFREQRVVFWPVNGQAPGLCAKIDDLRQGRGCATNCAAV